MSEADESDESLMTRYARGDAAAFATLYRRHEMRIWRYLERNIGNRATADELMQEVWFAVARDAPRYQPTARFTTWVFTIAHNRMIDALRAARPQLGLEELEQQHPEGQPPGMNGVDTGLEPFTAVVARDQAMALARALGQLPPEQREAFLLQVEGDLSVAEIAAITGSSFETAKSRLRYARARLRELLSEHR